MRDLTRPTKSCTASGAWADDVHQIHRGGRRRVLARGHQTRTTPAKSSSAFAPIPTRNAIAKWLSAGTHQRPVRRDRSRHPSIAMGSKLGIDATKKLPGEGFK